MPDIRIQVQGDIRLQKALNDPLLIRGPISSFLKRSALTVELNAKMKAPVDTGRLRSSIVTNFAPLRASVGPTVTYAPHVEYGTRPHWAPPGALQPWAGRHGFGAGARGDWLVRFIISKRGTRAHPFMRPAAQQSIAAIRRFANQMLLDIKMRWQSRAV